ncbi:MAG: hypothetical protein F6K00_06010 [Leptolyngbya sp. SIOISBB]|nr:hypothetical protein [Leptolyngbya sp. SIOISBB]
MSLCEEIDGTRSLFLARIEELEANGIILYVLAGIVGEPETVSIADADIKLENCAPIFVGTDSRGYKIKFEQYLAYSIRNESYAMPVAGEVFEGRRFRTYSRSQYLEFVYSTTFVNNQYPGATAHYGLVCEDHIIDVVSVDAPEIEQWNNDERCYPRFSDYLGCQPLARQPDKLSRSGCSWRLPKLLLGNEGIENA